MLLLPFKSILLLFTTIYGLLERFGVCVKYILIVFLSPLLFPGRNHFKRNCELKRQRILDTKALSSSKNADKNNRFSKSGQYNLRVAAVVSNGKKMFLLVLIG